RSRQEQETSASRWLSLLPSLFGMPGRMVTSGGRYARAIPDVIGIAVSPVPRPKNTTRDSFRDDPLPHVVRRTIWGDPSSWPGRDAVAGGWSEKTAGTVAPKRWVCRAEPIALQGSLHSRTAQHQICLLRLVASADLGQEPIFVDQSLFAHIGKLVYREPVTAHESEICFRIDVGKLKRTRRVFQYDLQLMI